MVNQHFHTSLLNCTCDKCHKKLSVHQQHDQRTKPGLLHKGWQEGSGSGNQQSEGEKSQFGGSKRPRWHGEHKEHELEIGRPWSHFWLHHRPPTYLSICLGFSRLNCDNNRIMFCVYKYNLIFQRLNYLIPMNKVFIENILITY